jgi:hypothetical protein
LDRSALEMLLGLEQNLFAVKLTPRTSSLIGVAFVLIAIADTAHAASPPQDLVKLERQVSLELAHVRDIGPTEAAKREQLFQARQFDQKGEDAIKAGDYKAAEDSLLRAQAILRQLGD